MPLKCVGYEIAPRDQFQSELTNFMTTGGWAGDSPAVPPSPAKRVFADDQGDCFVEFPIDGCVGCLPYIPGSCADMSGGIPGDKGGFVAADEMPSGIGGRGGAVADMLSGFAQQMPAQIAANWLGNAAKNAMLGAAPGGAMDGVMQSIGIANPLASGAVGTAMSSAMAVAGMGSAASLMPAMSGLLSGGGALGGLAMNNIVASTGLGNVPGAGALGGILGGELGGSMTDILSDGGWAGPLDDAGGCFGGCFPGGDAGPEIMGDPTNGGCFGNGGPDLSGISGEALSGAADQLMSQWQVDDESSAAEHIAHKAVNDNKAQLKQAVSDPNGFAAKMKKFFSGEAPGGGLPAVRISDLDDGADISNMGVGTILFQGLPVSRITDTVVGPKSPAPKPILEGAATVLSAGLPTAFVTAKTAVPSAMIMGAGTIFVGGAVAAISPPDSASAPDAKDNAGPAAPKGPVKPDGGSDVGDQTRDGADKANDAGDSTPGSEQESKTPTDPSQPGSDTSSESTRDPESSATSEEATNQSTQSGEGGMCEMPDDEPNEGGMSERPLPPLEQVTADGKVTPQEHLDRNQFNDCPIDNPGIGEKDGVEWWKKTPDNFHRPLECVEGAPTNGSLGPSSYECCYHPADGKLVDNTTESGTFNFYNSRDHIGKHTAADVLPHIVQNNIKGNNYSHVNMSLNRPVPPTIPTDSQVLDNIRNSGISPIGLPVDVQNQL